MSILESGLFYLHVLPKLPLKSLTRLKCVSKTLKAAISSTEFMQLHLRHQFLVPDTNDLLVIQGMRVIRCYDLDSRLLPVASTFFWEHNHSSVSIVGTSSGLLCLLRDSSLILLNPTTRICRAIPIPSNSGNATHFFGFASDHENLDFKIVAVCDQYYASAIKARFTMVYSLNSNSWRDVETTMPEDSIEGRNGGVLLNNHLLHWMFWSPSLRKRRIGCFDVCSEKWKDDVLLPAYYYDPSHKNYLLDFGVYDGCLFSVFENRVYSSFDVWVMKVHGVQDSWVKLLSIPVSSDLEGGVVPIVCRGESDDVLVRQRHRSSLFWCNRVDNGLTGVKLRLALNFSDFPVYKCMRSLVTLPGGVSFEELEEASGQSRFF